MPSDKALGLWLRQQREERGWTRPEMARQLIRAAHARGDTTVPAVKSMCHNIFRWERGAGGLSERYKLHYCHAFGVPPSLFGTLPPMGLHTATCQPGTATGAAVPSAQGAPVPAAGSRAADDAPALSSPVMVTAHRADPEPGMAAGPLTRLDVLAAAGESTEDAGQVIDHAAGATALEQLRADVVRLAALTDTGEPLSVFGELRGARSRAARLLGRGPWPRGRSELHFLLGCLECLLSATTSRLGYPDAAAAFARAAWAHAVTAGSRPLLAQVRAQQSATAYWSGRMPESRDLAASGLDLAADGPAAALHLAYAQAVASLGDTAAARKGVQAAHTARGQATSDDLLDLGGHFSVSLATHHAQAGAALAGLSGQASQAAAELEHAIARYQAGPQPGEHHWYGGKPLAGIELATIWLGSGALDAAEAALAEVLSVAPGRWVTAFTVRLRTARAELASPLFRGSAQARSLGERIGGHMEETAQRERRVTAWVDER